MSSGFSLYVHDLALAAAFYAEVLDLEPHWPESGGARFTLPDGWSLGLHPEKTAAVPGMPAPELAQGIPRGEVRIEVAEVEPFVSRAEACGGRLLEAPAPHPDEDGRMRAALLDLDGHRLLFAAAAPSTARGPWQRAHAALGPIAAGLLLDFFDLLTPGPLGYTVGIALGFAAGWYLSGIYRFRGMARLALALLAAAYLATPMTSFLPLATLVGGLARLREPRRAPFGA